MKLDNLLLELIVINVKRMDESIPEEAQGVFNTLTLVENLTEIDPKVSELLSERTDFFEWILKRLQKPEFDNNKQYASEILAITLQNSKGQRLLFVFVFPFWILILIFCCCPPPSKGNRLKVGALNGIDTLLTATSVRSHAAEQIKEKSQFEK